jgi:hypothetical protein
MKQWRGDVNITSKNFCFWLCSINIIYRHLHSSIKKIAEHREHRARPFLTGTPLLLHLSILLTDTVCFTLTAFYSQSNRVSYACPLPREREALLSIKY